MAITRAEYNALFNDATQITVAFCQQASIGAKPKENYDDCYADGYRFGKFWAGCLTAMAQCPQSVRWRDIDYSQPDCLLDNEGSLRFDNAD